MAKAQEIEIAQQEARLLRQLQQQGGGGEGEEEEEECGETSLNTPDEYTEDEDEVGNEVLDECPEYGNFDLRRQCHNNRYSHHELYIAL